MTVFSRNRLQIVAANTIAQLIGKSITAAITFLSLALIARAYGPSGVGEYTLVLTYLAVFYLLADAGLNAIVVREAVEEPTTSGVKMQSLVGLRLVWSTILIFISLAVMAFLPYSPVFKIGVVVLSLTIPFQGMLVSLNAFFQLRLAYPRSSLAVVVGNILTFVLTLVVISFGFSLVWLFPASLVGIAGTATMAYWLARGLGFKTGLAVKWHQLRGLIVSTLPLTITLALNLIAFKIDVFLLASLTNLSVLGQYNLAYKVFENIITVPTFALNALYPILVLERVASLEKLKHLARKAMIALIGISVLIMSVVILAAPLIINLLGGMEFGQSVVILRVLALSLPLFFLSSLTMWLLITLKKQWWLVAIHGLGLVVNIGLNLWLIPKLGGLAAAFNTGVTEGVIIIVSGLAILAAV